ncbi:hypothetical protein [Cohnella sp.]|uniref:hypothetical protein n=1 Tax=Cohnella sp. TaxID=1883426 RepID=UPI0035686576
MVKVEQAESYLKNKIGDSSDIAKVWEEFKAFGKEPVEGEDEIALLFQCGVYDLQVRRFFTSNLLGNFQSPMRTNIRIWNNFVVNLLLNQWRN